MSACSWSTATAARATRQRPFGEYQGTGHHLGNAAARDAVKKEALRKAGIGYDEVVAGKTAVGFEAVGGEGGAGLGMFAVSTSWRNYLSSLFVELSVDLLPQKALARGKEEKGLCPTSERRYFPQYEN